MSCLGLENHILLPSKKAWKRFAVSLGSKLHKGRRWRPAKQAGSAFSAILRRRRSQPPNTPFTFHARKLRHHNRSFRPVYVDELFNRTTEEAHVERDKQPAEMGNAKAFEHSVMCRSTALEACASSSSSSLSSSANVVRGLNEVDLRAEMFIAKFKEEMRLQRQRSFGEYQEMLARGV